MYLVLAFIVIGMVSGWLAHLIVENDRALDWPRVFTAGIVGSFVGGTLISLIAGNGFALRPSGIIGSVVGATLVLLVVNAARRPSHR